MGFFWGFGSLEDAHHQATERCSLCALVARRSVTGLGCGHASSGERWGFLPVGRFHEMHVSSGKDMCRLSEDVTVPSF